ncbi:MAG: hypothetical protein D6693_05910 [Planctomycetota bacterium]|nr:MAG: hypothetical protein D6693_05910 [Planctomycetota bacterium]
MTTPDHHRDRPGEARPTPSPGVVIRAGADGELAGAELDALHDLLESDPTTADRLAAERTLRARVARAMWAPDRAPDSLRDEIRELFRRQRAADAGARRTHPFRIAGPTWLAVAASLALLTAVAVVSRWPIAPAPWPTASLAPNAHLVHAADFILAEHERCSAFDDYFEHKFTVRDRAGAAAAAEDLLGAAPAIVELDDLGYRFAGLGRCAVPGPGVSLHILYAPADGADRPTLSLFVQREAGREALESGVRYRVERAGGATVYAWRVGELLYYLFSPDARVEAHAAQALEAPAAVRSL